MSDRVNHRDMSYITETVTETVTKTVAKTITKNITETVDTTYKIDTTTKDDYQCCNETLEETYQVQRCFKVEKVVFIGDYGVNKDPYNHLKHPEPELANDDDKYYYATDLEDEDADEDARIDYLWELLSRWQRQGNKWCMYLHTWVCIHTFLRYWVCKRYVFLLKGMYLKKIG
jgi:hypothetical protein